uniref:Uncharacterized protein n=1 Tax=Anguilla anguilla TaxID=7936 RepID=A0A0E9VK10_ANGAN
METNKLRKKIQSQSIHHI